MLPASGLINQDSVDWGDGAKAIEEIFETGRTLKAIELKLYAEAQGWTPTQTDGGHCKYIDESGILV